MSSLAALFYIFDRHIVAFLAQFLPSRRLTASRCADIFYGAFLSAVVIGIIQPAEPDLSAITPSSERPAIGEGLGEAISETSVEEAVARFAPELRFHPSERYFPSSVDWFLERSEMSLEVSGGADEPTLARGELAAEVIPAVHVEGASSGVQESSRYFLQIPNDEDERQTRQGDLDGAETYVHFREAADGSQGYDVQYWFFYPYSGPLMGGPMGGAHEGDWEHITVRLDEDLKTVRRVFFAAHEAEGRWMRPSRVDFVDETHPVVYVAKSGHASYPSAGLKPRGMLPADRTADGGASWQTWQSLQLVADEAGAREEFTWLRYSGRWGEVGSMFSGPHGPAFQHYWLGDG